MNGPLENVAIAMHCNLRPLVLLGCNYEVHYAPLYKFN